MKKYDIMGAKLKAYPSIDWPDTFRSNGSTRYYLVADPRHPYKELTLRHAMTQEIQTKRFEPQDELFDGHLRQRFNHKVQEQLEELGIIAGSPFSTLEGLAVALSASCAPPPRRRIPGLQAGPQVTMVRRRCRPCRRRASQYE